MKIFVVFILRFVYWTIGFATGDTLHTKKLNISLNANLLVPQTRNSEYVSDMSFPNSAFRATPTNSVYGTYTNKNAWSAAVYVDLKIYKKVYFQTGLSLSVYAYQSYAFGDSLYHNKGMVGNVYKDNGTDVALSIPLGLSYRFKQFLFLSAGILVGAAGSNIDSWAYYKTETQLTATEKLVQSTQRALIRYITLNVKNFKRTYLNLGITDTSWKKDDIYYSLGAKFFVF